VRRERRTGQDPESLVKSLADLQAGALVVHLEHGIGRYLGLEVLDVGDSTGEYLTLEYDGGDKLYVPVTDLHLVSRYTGADPESVTLNRLGSEQWKKTRRKAAEKVRDVAAELLNLQARRAARQRTCLSMDRGMYARFAAGFEYEETDDQLDAIEAVLADLASEQPMDRVSAAMSASARPKWPCERPLQWPNPAARWPCWRQPRCWPSSTTATSVTASPTGRSECRPAIAHRQAYR
jgi:transcription-repair coupling factor (superfamily II helicase)